MISKHQKMIGVAILMFLWLCGSPHSAMGKFGASTPGAGPRPAKPKNNTSVTARLVTRGNQPVLVNGYSSYTGATVLTGATIQTPDGVRATLQLANLGSFDLSPNTIAVLEFDIADLKGTLKRGCAVLTTYPKVNGKLLTPDGATMATDSLIRSSVTACSEENAASEAASANNKSGSSPWVFDVTPGSMVDMVRAGIFWGAAGNRGRCCCCCCCRNPSPSDPNDCGCK
ncbi:MAG: hypothetical protein JNK38_20495 [Acidobacteria bacterium]|nr:hypothetical protein [Acidobacteriota bacterium]